MIEFGISRHNLSRNELDELYKKLDNFIADCTEQEAERERDAFVRIKTLIHQRMRDC